MVSEKGGTSTENYRIVRLLEMLADGELVLPEFQRDFDWDDERIRQLLATVVRRWPAGSLLLQEFSGKTFFSLRGFDGGPEVEQDKVQFVILDGQQRLTALYHAVYDAGAYVYAVRAGAIAPNASIEALEDGIQAFSRQRWDAEYRDAPITAENDWIPFYALRSASDYFGWRDRAMQNAGDAGRDSVALLLSRAYRDGLEALHTYQLPAVIVDRRLEPEAIARIFERVNRGGLTLTAFDLMVARTFEPGWNLRDRWQEALAEHPILERFFRDDGMPIIRVIALKALGSVRQGDVLRLEGLAVRQDWDDAVRAAVGAVRFLSEGCGVRDSAWLPYAGMVTTLAALALEVPLSDHRMMLRRWFISRSFGLAYESAANTVAVEEYRHLHRVATGQEHLRRMAISRATLESATRKRRAALWRAFVAALQMQGALDPLSGESLTEDARPIAILRRGEVAGGESPHLFILNLGLASRQTARKIEGQGYGVLQGCLNSLGEELAGRVRASQFLGMPSGRIESEAARLLSDRLSALEEWFIRELGYGFDETASSDAGRVGVLPG